ncbi:MAG: hypothetical protein DRH97_03120 [Chloroflexi bacterium]|jgi:multimeric flavodoxin WrbA|nr:MAG: hypothetical protein DRH97_03120 [Chloroflexota bacterium]
MTAKKVLVALGSPRREANSTILAQRAADGARDAGADVELLDLPKMDIKACDGCDACHGRSSKGCIIRDDMQALYPKLRQADIIIMASPVYWFTFTAQIKLFMDRWYGLWGAEGEPFEGVPFRDKRVGVILTGEGRDPFESGGINAIRTLQDTFTYLGSPPIRVVYGSAGKAGEIRGNEEVMSRAYSMGKTLAEV